MDVLSEGAGSGGRVLIARHISSDKHFPASNFVNTTALCYSTDLPDVQTYISGLQFYGPVLWTCSAVVVVIIYALFTITVKASMRHRPDLVSQAIFILAVYPVVATVSLIALLVPRALLLAEALSQQTIMIAMFQLFLFIVGDCGGPDQLVRRAEGAKLETRVLPCCCWPCCIIPRPPLQETKLFTLRMLVLQMPIVQAVIYIAMIIMWAENPEMYHSNKIYFQPAVAASILTGVWGMVMTVRAAEAAGVRPRGKFLALQLVLVVLKVQGGIANVLPTLFTLPCHPPLTPMVYVNLVHNGLVILQMLLLSTWAWRLYSVPPSKMSDQIQQVRVVAVLDERNVLPTALDIRHLRDGVENKCFTVENRN